MTTDSKRVSDVLLDLSAITTLALTGVDMSTHKEFAQHQIVLAHDGAATTGVLQVRGVPQAGKMWCVLTSDLEAVDFNATRNPVLFFQGYYEALTFELTTVLGATRDLQAILTSSNDLNVPVTP